MPLMILKEDNIISEKYYLNTEKKFLLKRLKL